ncbi:MAG: ABC transporter substrate-binding protein [Oscillospiraceae bacterium]|nr:ABC transporter substrate-binding protein [Oscillospiraceae bacterium]
MKMKKILAAAAAAAMLCGLTACNTDNNSSDPAVGNDVSPSISGGKVYNVGICQLIEHPALDLATKGFQDVLKEKLGDNVKIDVQRAQGESANCATIVNSFVSANVDLIMANATPALAAAVSGTGTIPIVGTSITSYEVALGDGWTGKNVTGASDLAPLDQQEDMIIEIFPDARKVGILYCSAEPNSDYQAKIIKQELEKDGIECKEYTVADSNEIQAQTQAAVSDNCDVIYIPTDNTFANAAETVKNVVVPAGVPVVAGEEGICGGCGTVTLSISYESMGRAAGEMAYEILVNGKNPGEMSVGYSETTKKYNKEICDALGVTVPDGYTAIE